MIYQFIYCTLLSAGQGFYGALAGAEGARGLTGWGRACAPSARPSPLQCVCHHGTRPATLRREILNRTSV